MTDSKILFRYLLVATDVNKVKHLRIVGNVTEVCSAYAPNESQQHYWHKIQFSVCIRENVKRT
jgi:hypothetical protein